MELRLTGRMRLAGPGGTVDAADLPGRQGRIVLTSLALTTQPVPRETLADRLWGDRLPKAWERDLSAIVSKLRSLLARVGLGQILSDAATYHLRLPAGAEVDVQRARRAAGEAEQLTTSGPLERSLALAEEVVEIASRPFLPGEDAPWLDEVRSELQQLRLRGLEISAAALAGSGRSGEAIRALEQVLEVEPFRESATRQLMGIQLAGGNRAEAVRTYENLRIRLASELGIDPAPSTERRYLEALRATEAPADDAGGVTQPVVPVAPEVRYARSGRVNIAYQVVGDGPVDLVVVPGWISNIELCWHEPRMAGFLAKMATFSRLILFDKRGTGLSDPIPIEDPPSLEERMDDVRAVMDAAGSERAVILGFSEGGSMSVLFAATHPERTAGLILWGTWSRQIPDEDFPFGWTREEGRRRMVRPIRERGVVDSHWFAPSLAGDDAFQQWFIHYARQSASPGMAIGLLRANASVDVRPVLPSVHVPTIVLHRTHDILVEVDQGRYLAQHIPGARFVEFPGIDHWPWVGDEQPILAEIANFVRSVESPVEVGQQMLATVLAATLPDVGAPAVGDVVAEHRGVIVNRTSGTLLARFDGPGRAVRCALELVRRAPDLGCAALHTGELTMDGSAVRGVPVDLALELISYADNGEVLVTRTVTDLVAGSHLSFSPRGHRELGAVGTAWALFAAS